MLVDIYEALLNEDEQIMRLCERQKYQASGSGGQKRNKVATAVRITHNTFNVMATCSSHREYSKNLKEAIQRLRLKLSLESKKYIKKDSLNDRYSKFDFTLFRSNANPKHNDYFISVFLVILKMHQNDFSWARAAKELGVSTSKLIKFVEKDKSVKMTMDDLIREQRNHDALLTLHNKSGSET